MIANIALLSDFRDEQQRRLVGPARHFLATDRDQPLRRVFAARTDFITETGDRVRRNCYSLLVALNTRRADLGLSQFDLPPAQPVFSTRPGTQGAFAEDPPECQWTDVHK